MRNTREDGNNQYRRAMEPGLSRSVRLMRFDSALKSYNKSLALCNVKDQDEQASCFKNLCMVSWRLAEIHSSVDGRLSSFHAREAATHFVAATHLCHTKSKEWLELLVASCRDSLKGTLEQVQDVNIRLDILRDVTAPFITLFNASRLANDGGRMRKTLQTFASLLFLERARAAFYRSGFALEHENSKSICGTLLSEAEEACRSALAILLPDEDAKAPSSSSLEAKKLLDDIVAQSLIVEAKSALVAAKSQFNHSIFDEDYDPFAVLVALDLFQHVLVVSAGNAAEAEAEACALMGQIYFQILKEHEKGNRFCLQSVQLAASMHPKIFNHLKWYQTSVEIVNKWRVMQQRNEEAAWSKRRAPIIQKLKPVLDQIESEASKPLASFLTFLFQKHTPKDNGATCGPLDAASIKATLLRTIRMYHPDKNSKAEHGDEWFVLCEEISKLLNMKLEIIKGVA